MASEPKRLVILAPAASTGIASTTFNAAAISGIEAKIPEAVPEATRIFIDSVDR